MLIEDKLQLIVSLTRSDVLEIIKAKYVHLKGSVISRRAAAKKYHIDVSSVAYWEKKGYVRKMGLATKGDRAGQQIDEFDVAVKAEMSKLFYKRRKT